MTPELAQRIFGTSHAMVLWVVATFAGLLLAAAWHDVKRRRIPNKVVFPGMLLAILAHTALPPGNGFLAMGPGGLGFPMASAGLVLGLGVMLPLYLSRAMGAGDVKLMGMAGAFLGPIDLWPALFATVISGGILALGIAAQRRILLRTFDNIRILLLGGLLKTAGGPAPLAAAQARLPYAVAIAGGCIGYMAYRLTTGLF